jgi:hypothetical protein
MLNDDLAPYRWQDHVVTSRRASLNLMATVLIVAMVATAGLFDLDASGVDPAPHVAAATEQTPSLTQSAKRPGTTAPRPEARGGC